MIAGGTMAAVLDGRPLPPASEPRLEQVRPVNGRLQRISGYLMMAFGAALTADPPDVTEPRKGSLSPVAPAVTPTPETPDPQSGGSTLRWRRLSGSWQVGESRR